MRFSTFGIALSSLLIASCTSFQGGIDDERLHEADSEEAAGHSEPFLYDAVASIATYGAKRLRQVVYVLEEEDVRGESARNVLLVENLEIDPATREEHLTTRLLRTSGDIVGLGSRCFNDLLVAIREGGTLRVERWVLHQPAGAWNMTRPIAQSTGAWTTPGDVTFIEGGQWIDSEERHSNHPPETRTTLLTRSDDRGFASIAADPDGRFFLLASEAGIEQFSMEPGAKGSVVMEPGVVPGLSHVESMAPFEVQRLGRVYLCEFDLSKAASLDNLVLIDHENDGHFEDWAMEKVDGDRPWNRPLLQSIVRDFALE